MSDDEWSELESEVQRDVASALEGALNRPEPDTSKVTRYRFAEPGDVQLAGGLAPSGHRFPESTDKPAP